jgi:hypothetical protein
MTQCTFVLRNNNKPHGARMDKRMTKKEERIIETLVEEREEASKMAEFLLAEKDIECYRQCIGKVVGLDLAIQLIRGNKK